MSCLTLDDVQGFNPDDWFNIFRNRNAKENLKDGFGVKINFRGIFKTDYDRSSDIAQSKGVITQTDLFQLDLYANGGLRYAQEGYNLPRSALNFAKADINAIEVAYYHNSENKYSGSVGYGDEVVPKNNVALELDEIESYYSKNEIKKDDTVKDAMQELNLDDDPFRVTSQEYASYMLALDVDYDGVITSKEANVEFSDELRGIALSYYNEFFVE